MKRKLPSCLVWCAAVVFGCGDGSAGVDPNARVDRSCPGGCAKGQKCTIQGTPPAVRVSCVAEGTVRPGDPCFYDPASDTDDCVAGSFCGPAASGDPNAPPACTRFCASDSDCESGSICGAFPASEHLPGGSCVQSCSIFGSECGPGATCSSSRLDTDGAHFPVCRPVGPGLAGDPCQGQLDCGANEGCANGVCTELCDQNHPCPAAKACEQTTGLLACF